jgi:hypothetical protein
VAAAVVAIQTQAMETAVLEGLVEVERPTPAQAVPELQDKETVEETGGLAAALVVAVVALELLVAALQVVLVELEDKAFCRQSLDHLSIMEVEEQLEALVAVELQLTEPLPLRPTVQQIQAQEEAATNLVVDEQVDQELLF